MTKIAICYWGLTRTLPLRYESHERHIFSKLREKGIEYDKYVHTWYNICNPELKNPLFYFYEPHNNNLLSDYSPYNIYKIKNDDQVEFRDYLIENISKYWYQNVWEGNNCRDSYNEWHPLHLIRSLMGYESIKRVTKMVLESGIEYDYVLYIRPDLEITTDFEIDLLDKMKKDSIIVLSYQWGSSDDDYRNINDVFAVVPLKNVMGWGYRIDDAPLYRSTVGRLAVETFVGWITKRYYKDIIRSDMKLSISK